MAEMSLAEEEVYSLKCAAYHECGHAFVARHYGMWAFPMLWRNPNRNTSDKPRFDEWKIWIGKTQYSNEGLTRMRHRRLAIAGPIAEHIVGTGSIEDCSALSLCYFVDESLDPEYENSDGWSRTDWDGAQGWTNQDVDAVHSIFKRNWKALVEEAEMLISNAQGKDLSVSTSEMLLMLSEQRKSSRRNRNRG